MKNCMDHFVKDYRTPGVDCMVCREHEVVFRYFTGMRDLENQIKMDGNELYLIFSMTKMLTCTAALQLFEQGKFLLKDNLSMYFPEFAEMKLAGGEFDTEAAARITTGGGTEKGSEVYRERLAKNPITIKDLFTMGAGLDYALDDKAITEALEAGKTSTGDLVRAMAGKALGFEPGTRFRYSLCHDVLGALVEVLSGISLGEYMEANIFAPLGMKNTFFGIPKTRERLDKMAVRYTYDAQRIPQRLPLECAFNLSEEYESGGAGLTSCTEDYALFLDALACGGMGKNGSRILAPATVALMGTNHLKGQQVEDFYQLRQGYGYGLGVRTHIDKTESGSLSPLGEFGWDGAAGAFSMVDPENKISMTYFQHIHNWDVRIQTEMRNALYGCLD